MDDIAARAALSKSVIWEHLKIARAESGEPVPSAVDGSLQHIEPAPSQPMTRDTIMQRALAIADHRPSPTLKSSAILLWAHILIAIHEDGDGVRLPFGRGQRFSSRADLFVLCPHEAPADVAALVETIERGRLVDADGDLEAPHGFGVRRGENVRGKLMKPRVPRQRSNGDQSSLGFRPQFVGGRDFAGNQTTQVEPLIAPESESGRIADQTPVQSPFSPDLTPLTQVAAAASKAFEYKHSKAEAAASPRESPAKLIAPDGNGAIRPESDSGLIPANPSAARELAVALRGLMHPVRKPSPDDIATVQGWLEAGFTLETVLEVAEAKLEGYKGTPIYGLSFFTPILIENSRARFHSKTAATVLPPPPPNPVAPGDELDEPVASDGVPAQWQKIRRIMGPDVSRGWLMKCRVVDPDENGELIIVCPTTFLRDRIRSEYGDRLNELWRAENHNVCSIRFTAIATAAAAA